MVLDIFGFQSHVNVSYPLPRLTESGNQYNESCLKKVQGDKTNYKPATGKRSQRTNFTVLITIFAVLKNLTKYDLFVVEQIMSSTITKNVLMSSFGKGSKHLHAYCNETRTCSATTVLHSLTDIAKRIVLFQGYTFW